MDHGEGDWLPVRNEVSTLGRVKDVQYAVSTSSRRHDLVNDWETAARDGHGVTGALVQIAQSPFEVPDAFAQDDRWPDRAARACNLHVLLPGCPLPPLPTEEEFRELIG